MLFLQVETRSPLCAASGVGRPGTVDRDVVFDALGVPYLPGRRLKGLLRDAYQEVVETGALAAMDLPSAVDLFGDIGEVEGGAVSVGSARLTDAAEIGKLLSGLARNLIRREDVIAHYTGVRHQTAIDRRTGAPDDNSLRATRVVRTGLAFQAEVVCRCENGKLALGLAAAGVQHMGASRTRGLGWVCCFLREGTKDWTAEAIQRVRPPGGKIGKLTSPAGRFTPALAADPSSGGGEAHVLPFILTLREPAILPSMEGDPNTVATLEFIPGSAIQGILASRFRDANWGRSGDIAVSGRFYELFTSGRVSFLAAYPAIDGNVRACPAPVSLREYKSQTGLVDLAEEDPEQGKTLRRVPRWTNLGTVQQGSDFVRVAVRQEIHYHHQRAQDRRAGRALGERGTRAPFNLAAEHTGTLFTYESLAASQCFRGAIVGPEQDLTELAGLIRAGDSVLVGRSRGAQYGGCAQWNWCGPNAAAEIVLTGNTEASDWNREGEQLPSSELVVTLLAPMITVNGFGHPAPAFPLAEFALRLGVENDALDVGQAYVRQQWESGFLSHQRLPWQQMPALAPGSVFVISCRSEVRGTDMRRAEAAGYGLRTEAGFGRVSVRGRSGGSPPGFDPEIHTAEVWTQPDSAKPAPGSAGWTLAFEVLKRSLEEHMMARAADLAGRTKVEGLAPHALHRLLELARAHGAAKAEVDKIRNSAREPLDRRLVYGTDLGLASYVADLEAHGGEFYSEAAKSVFAGWEPVFGNDNLLLGQPAAPAIRRFLIEFLGILAWRLRPKEDRHG